MFHELFFHFTESHTLYFIREESGEEGEKMFGEEHNSLNSKTC